MRTGMMMAAMSKKFGGGERKNAANPVQAPPHPDPLPLKQAV